MADMAPALTGAAHEAPHRLTLSSASSNAWKARGGLLLLNGGGRAEDAPGPGELMEGAPGPGRREEEEEEDGPAKRLDIAPGPGRRLQGAPGTGYTIEGAPGPRRRTLGEGRRKPPGPAICPLPEGPAATPPKSAHGPAVTPSNQVKGHPEPMGNLAKGHPAPGPTGNQVKGHPEPMGNQAKGHLAPEPMGNLAKGHPAPGPTGNLAKGHPASGPTGSNTKVHLATEPMGSNAKGHLAGRDLAPEPTGRTEGVTDRVPGPLTCIPGSRGPLDIVPGPLISIPGTRGPQEVARGPVTSKPAASQGCTPGTRGHQDFAPGSVTSTPGSRGSQDFAAGPHRDSQDAAPGPGVLCARRAAQMSSRQQELGARARRLCRRLQVIQAKQVERHVRQQLSGLVELLSERGPAGLPGAPHVELDRLACSSTARLRAAQGGFDSDATESSSGGESDEEEEDEDEEDEAAGESPGHERAEEEPSRPTGSDRHSEWRWAVERAAIICRWTWLQAQVSDLEFRIRQQTEIYKQIRCTKGSVALGDPPHCEDSAARLNARGNRVPSSCTKTAPKTPSGDDPCDSLCNTPSPSPQSLDKQCSRLMQSVENVACQNPPTTPVCDSSGSQKSSRQVNGLINCVRSSASCNGSTEDLDPEEVLGKKRRVDPPSSSPALSDSSCVAARSRPLRSHKKRSLVRASDVASLSRKPQKPLSTKCGCDPPTTCILCGCKTYAKTSHPSTLALNERIALMDPCYHPILSFPYDTPLHLHFEALLKEDRQFRVSNKLKILKLSQLAKKPHEAGRSMLRDDRQYKGVPSPSIHVSSAVTPRPNTAAHQLPSINDTPPSASQNSSSAALKRKRFENSYDIDNIVIPMSLVAASRVEKLQYKEILTPSWRVLDSAEIETLDVDPQLEDLSDDAYQDRHSKYEDLERSRWDSWTSATPQRRGSRSSNKSDGRWTPQPPNSQGSSQQTASPDIRFQSLNDLPLSLSSAASDSPEPYSTVQCLSVHSRTRVLSWSEDTRSSTPEIPDDEEQIIQPWEPRSFPLTDRDCRTLQNMPGTPSRGRTKPPPDVSWQTPSKPSGAWTENIDSGMSTENLTPASKEPPLPNSISVVRVRAHSGDKIASLEYFPARPVNKR